MVILFLSRYDTFTNCLILLFTILSFLLGNPIAILVNKVGQVFDSLLLIQAPDRQIPKIECLLKPCVLLAKGVCYILDILDWQESGFDFGMVIIP